MNQDKKVVSPFELAIMEIADPEMAKKHRAETNEEKEERLKAKFIAIAKRIKVKL